MTRRVRVALIAAALGLWLVPVALAQDGQVIPDPTASALATAAGVAAVVALITNILRGVVPADVFDRWGPTLAVGIGVLLGLIGLFVSPGTHDGNAVVTAALVGLFGGWQSQNVNTQVTRALVGPPQKV